MNNEILHDRSDSAPRKQNMLLIFDKDDLEFLSILLNVISLQEQRVICSKVTFRNCI